jgi:dTMP kinase
MARNYSGLFVSFEGGEGAGKGTQIKLFNKYLEDRFGKERVVWTREPGGTEPGEDVRRLLLNNSYQPELNKKAELLLFYASRAQLVGEVIEPHLSRGAIVVADRFFDSSAAYQGAGRGLGFEFIQKHLTPFTVGDCVPDLTLCLDVDAKQGLENISYRPGEVTRIDQETLDFHLKVNQAFRDIAVQDPGRVKLVPYFHNQPQKTHKVVVNHFEDLVARTSFK